MKVIYIIIVFMAMAMTSTAQQKKNPLDVRNYKTELELTQNQLTQINSIYTNFDSRIKLQAPAENTIEKMQNYANILRERQKEIRKVLTVEQIHSYRQIMKAQQLKIKQ